MARDESDREDLLREATALVARVELSLPEHDDHWVAGFRRNGAVSLFFGVDPVLQFNSVNELRRAFVQGTLYKAEGGRLVRLVRVRAEGEVVLSRSEPVDAEQAQLLAMMRDRVRELAQLLAAAQYRVIGEVPEGAHVVERLCDWLEKLPTPFGVAEAPNVGV